ncbi:lipid asymmetry maintenance protein MlaB [Uliginosibacterium paludis]|uniref:STAS domain-containing protein n=1 Tax=Uliginosibacterium paludis TaxID=1615952 RepID=A0ABV2CNF8_9RHOO
MTALAVSGALDRIAAHELLPQLLDLASSGDILALDLSAVSAIDGAGLQLLLAVRREAARAGTHLALANPSPVVSEQLRVHHLEHVLGACVVCMR